jgi:hypothetical protein
MSAAPRASRLAAGAACPPARRGPAAARRATRCGDGCDCDVASCSSSFSAHVPPPRARARADLSLGTRPHATHASATNRRGNLERIDRSRAQSHKNNFLLKKILSITRHSHRTQTQTRCLCLSVHHSPSPPPHTRSIILPRNTIAHNDYLYLTFPEKTWARRR